MTDVAALPGLDLRRLTAWLDATRPGLRRGPLAGELIAGGRSNLTYRVTDGETVWALRRPPLGHVLPTAHDMAREYRVLSALRTTDVPVPEVAVLCPDATVLGCPFYLMAFVDGQVLDTEDAVGGIAPDAARRAGELLIDTLLALHDIDPQAVGLGDFGRPAGFLARQLDRWRQQWTASRTRPLADLPLVVEGLGATIPPQSAPGITHGDYRIGNTIYAPDLTRIAAVIDWEMATVGDPLADLGLLIVYHTLAAEGGFRLAPLRATDGFLTPDELTERYRAGAGRSLRHLPWYVAFGYFKLAVVTESIRRRHQAGQTVGAGFDDVADTVPVLLRSALRSLAAAQRKE